MSDSFEVYPGNNYVPTLKEFTELVIARRNEFLLSRNLPARSNLEVDFIDNKQVSRPDGNMTMQWADAQWLNLSGIYCDYYIMDDDDLDLLKDDSESPNCGPEAAEILKRSMTVGYYWSFGRSASHPSLTYVTQGILAGAMAELTGGVVTSTDKNWACHHLPLKAEAFYQIFFRPEGCNDPERREWFNYHLEELRRQGASPEEAADK